jgi:hypothetical protein
VTDPRVVALPDGSWGGLFVSNALPAAQEPQRYASATLWFGQYADGEWVALRELGNFEHVYLRADRPSTLVRGDSTVAFAFAFDRSRVSGSNSRGNQGVVLVRVAGGDVQVDTLHTWAAATYVRLAANHASGSFRLLTSESYFDAGRPWPSALFLTEFRRGWRERRRLFADSARSLTAPMIAARDSTLVLGWLRLGRAAGDATVAQQAILYPSGQVGIVRFVDRVSALPGASITALAGGQALWLLPVVAEAPRLRVILMPANGPGTSTDLNVPFENIRATAAALDDDTVLLLTGSTSSSGREPPAYTIATSLVPLCPPAD